MNLYQNIASTDFRDYAKSRGWQQLADAVADGLFVLSNPAFEKRQLVIPINSSLPDYADAISIALHKLAELENRPVTSIISALNEIKDDTLRFRVVDTRNEEKYIPLSYAVSAINGTKEMLLSAACTVLKPQAHHPRLSRSEALELVDKSKFRHTETGSFVIKVSTPVKALDIQGNLFEDELPFVRQTTLVLNNAMGDLVTAIEADTLDNLIDEVKAATAPYLSSNLCKAITNFQEDHNDYDLYIDFSWAGALPVPASMPLYDRIKIQKDYFSRIDDVRRELKNTEQQKIDDVFMATVERLSGEIGDDNNRSGEVILNLYKEGEVIRARTILDAEAYRNADLSHMTAGSFLKIKGKLHQGNQPRNLTDITLVELILP
ncbi:hypothetical protein MKQ68_04470 [Chitinophaga horti]|uniref:Uncharacterized protein n=1 Tax=Chitinophaga horti TaxID=2920382 RepID=A0ABY6J3V1_9BACT|nr:hypothetical protein [Chitinophaga horti]UYQ94343.1 hypothetical protein MKQ68_04470 [Chitinophaga horti]